MSAGAASAAGTAGGAVASAGAFSRFFITDHAAQQQTHDQNEHGNKSDIDQIGG